MVTDQEINQMVAQRLRGVVAEKRVNKKYLAEKAGISYRTLLRGLAGEAPFTISNLFAIAQVLQVSTASLLPPAVLQTSSGRAA